MRVLFSILSLFVALNLFGKEINVTYPTNPFNLQVMIMRKKGFLFFLFAKDGIKIKFHDITNGFKQAKAVAAGKVDICAAICATSIIIAAGHDIKLNIIRAIANPTGTLALMTTNHNIKSIKDLKGKTIAGASKCNLHQLLLEALSKNDMTIKDVKYIPMSVAETYKAMFAGKVDAALLTATQILRAEDRGARSLTTAKGLMRPKDVVAVSESFAKKHPSWIGKYVQAQNEAMAFIKNHKHEALQLAAEDLDISYREAEWLYDNSNFINTLNKDDIMSLKDDIEFLFNQKMIPKKVDILSRDAAIDIIFENFVRGQISIGAVSYN